jgi:hypothetical protein
MDSVIQFAVRVDDATAESPVKPLPAREASPHAARLAVAVGGIADELPETLAGPDQFPGARDPAQYLPGRLQASGT